MNTRVGIRIGIMLAVLVPFLMHAAGYWNWSYLDRLESLAYDARLLLTMPRTIDDRVVIVDLDERSLNAEGQWPWPRDKMAHLVDQLFEHYRVRAVGFDILFAEPDRNFDLAVLDRLAAGPLRDDPAFLEEAERLRPQLERDRIFAESLRNRPTVLGYVFRRALGPDELQALGELPAPVFTAETHRTRIAFEEPEGYTGILPVLEDAANAGGFFENETFDIDGVFRRVPVLRRYQGAIYESLAMALTRVAVGSPPIEFEFYKGETGPRDGLDLEWLHVGSYKVPVDEQVTVLVPYRGRHYSFPYVSATDVLNGRASLHPLMNAIVLVGTSAPGLFDLRNTPVGQEFTGVEVHANIVSGILDQRIKHHPQYTQGIVVTMLVLAGILLTLLIPRLSVMTATLLTLLVMVILTGSNFLVWQHANLVIPLASPLAFIFLLYLFHLIYGYAVETRGKRQLSALFGQYVPPELVEEMDRNPGRVTMETESRQMTVLFGDIRGFTSIAENLQARELSRLLNEILTPMTRVIHRHRGTIDKYMGDGIMAFWGAPLQDRDHAKHAVQAGFEIVDVMQELAPKLKKRGWPEIQLGLGISTGVMRVGNMGSEFRVAYTVIGDAVNLGSRLEALTKEYGVNIAVSEGTRDAVSDFAFIELDRVRVKGKEQPVAVFQPLGPRDTLPPETIRMLRRHEIALKRYRAADWDGAEEDFFALHQLHPEQRIFRVYLDRIAQYRFRPPDTDWSGVYKVMTK